MYSWYLDINVNQPNVFSGKPNIRRKRVKSTRTYHNKVKKYIKEKLQEPMAYSLLFSHHFKCVSLTAKLFKNTNNLKVQPKTVNP
jgi:hypothetical protein